MNDSGVFRCDMCGDKHDRNDVVILADGDGVFSICKFCESFLALTEFDSESEITKQTGDEK